MSRPTKPRRWYGELGCPGIGEVVPCRPVVVPTCDGKRRVVLHGKRGESGYVAVPIHTTEERGPDDALGNESWVGDEANDRDVGDVLVRVSELERRARSLEPFASLPALCHDKGVRVLIVGPTDMSGVRVAFGAAGIPVQLGVEGLLGRVCRVLRGRADGDSSPAAQNEAQHVLMELVNAIGHDPS